MRDYLLSPEHPVGRGKARFFNALGFTRAAWPLLERALLEAARTGEAGEGPVTLYGKKFEVRAIIRGPLGREAAIVSVWIVRVGEDFPRLVTAYPGEVG